MRPSQTLPITLTGNHCRLQCAHCGGHYLQSMVPVEKADATGRTSCLISGGCDERGRVPIGPHLPRIRELRSGRVLNWHVGLIDEEEMRAIAPLVDVISFDWVGNDQTIREVYGLDYRVTDYACTYSMLRRYVRVVPHLTLGLRGGEMSGEYQALDQLGELGLEALVLLVFIPTPGTRFDRCQPPSVASVVAFIEQARSRLTNTPVYLGCMRPGGRYRRELDPLAVSAGVSKVVNPARSAVERAQELGRSICWESECCVIQRT